MKDSAVGTAAVTAMIDAGLEWIFRPRKAGSRKSTTWKASIYKGVDSFLERIWDI